MVLSAKSAPSHAHMHIYTHVFFARLFVFLFYCLAFFFCFNHTNAVVRENATECLFTKKHLNVHVEIIFVARVPVNVHICWLLFFFSFLQYYIINMIIVFFLCFFSEMLIASHCFIFLSIVIDFSLLCLMRYRKKNNFLSFWVLV